MESKVPASSSLRCNSSFGSRCPIIGRAPDNNLGAIDVTTPSLSRFLKLPDIPSEAPISIPNAADLKETKEIKFTPEMKALAAKLKTPLAIYRWVYDHIEFRPTYGSEQGADFCRQTQKCNAF
ncbi:MAG: hypothetical protein AAF412_14810, partial [Pseudomonadota bacterium]